MNDPRIPALLVSHRRPGFYFRVLEEGEVQAGDEILKLASGPEQMTVAEVDALLYLPGHPRQQLLRALRIPALSPGWQASFRALLDGEPRSGNAGLTRGEPASGVARLPSADRHRDRARERLGDLRSASRIPTARRSPPPARASTSPCASSPTAEQRSVLRNYSLSGPPDAGYYRISVKREPTARPAAICTPASRVGDQLEIAAPRGTFILDPSRRAGAADQRRHRRDAGARHASRAGRGAFRAGDLVAARRAQQPRPLFRGRGSRAPRVAPERTHPHLLQPSRLRRSRRPRLRHARAVSPARCSPSSIRRAMPRHTSAGRLRSWRRSAPAWPRSASTPPASTPSRSGRHRA